jgi:hypothetical protein
MMGTRRPLHPKPEQCILSLGTFAVTLDSFDIPVTIILLYALAPRVGNECFPRRSVSLAHICPNMHPEYHHEMQSIRAAGNGSYEAEVTLAFDYTFQHLLDHKNHRDGTLDDEDVFRGILEVEDTAHAVTHRFIADGTLIVIEPEDDDKYGFDEIVLSYERVEQEASRPENTSDSRHHYAKIAQNDTEGD